MWLENEIIPLDSIYPYALSAQKCKDTQFSLAEEWNQSKKSITDTYFGEGISRSLLSLSPILYEAGSYRVE